MLLLFEAKITSLKEANLAVIKEPLGKLGASPA